MLYLGIDQHRKQLTVCIRNEMGDVVFRRQVSTEWKRVRAFLIQVCKMAGTGGFVVILEICGFNNWLVKLLGEYGCRKVLLVQPEKRSNKKTDRRDANALCEVLWVNRQRLLEGKRVQGVRCVEWPTDEDAAHRQLTEQRKRLGQLRTRTINGVKHLLRKHNLEQECPTKGLDTIKGKKWLGGLPLDWIDRLEMDNLLAQWRLWDAQIETPRGPDQAASGGEQDRAADRHDSRLRGVQQPGAGLADPVRSSGSRGRAAWPTTGG